MRYFLFFFFLRYFHCLRLFAHKILINYKEERVTLQQRSLGRCHFNEVTEVSTVSNGPSREPAAPEHLMGWGETPAKDTAHKPNRGAPSTATAQQSSELSKTHLRTRRRSQTEQQMCCALDQTLLLSGRPWDGVRSTWQGWYVLMVEERASATGTTH